MLRSSASEKVIVLSDRKFYCLTRICCPLFQGMKINGLCFAATLSILVPQTCTVDVPHWNRFSSLFADSPKPWMTYAEKSVQEITERTYHRYRHSKPMVALLTDMTLCFHIFTCNSNIRHVGYVIVQTKHKPVAKTDSCLVRSPLGSIDYDSKRLEPTRILRGIKESHVNVHWNFSLSKMLDLKLEVTELNVRMTFDSCLWGNVSLLKTKSSNNAATNKSRDSLTLCGKHAPFSIHTSGSYSRMLVNHHVDIEAKIHVNFSAITSGIVRNLHLKTDTFPLVIVHHMLQMSLIQYTMLLQVPKHQKICVNSSRTMTRELVFYNGPGLLSPKVKVNRLFTPTTTFCFSSFQVVLQFSEHKVFESAHFTVKVAFAGRLSSHCQLHADNPIGLSYSFSSELSASTNHNIIQATAPAKLHVSITIHWFHYRGIATSTCRFGGLSFSDHNNNILTESTLLCTDTNSTSHRSIYSSESTIHIVIYSYRQYSNVSGYLHVSSTKCHAVKINLCEVFHRCTDLKRGPHDCYYLLHEYNSLPYLTLGFDRTSNSVYFEETLIHYRITPGHCVVFQTGNDLFTNSTYLLYSGNSCDKLTLKPEHRPCRRSVFLYKFTITGTRHR